MARLLLSSTSRVQAPIIIVQIGDVSFGLYSRSKAHLEAFGKYYEAIKVTYPNYIKSLSVDKINGAVNNYTLTLEYAITERDDPNLIDKILGKVSKSRRIIFTYGDATLPNYLYREERATITDVRSSTNFASQKITYTIKAVSDALKLTASTHSFPRRINVKPSSIVYELLSNKSYGLQEIFYGMHNLQTVRESQLIDASDQAVNIEAKDNIDTLSYLKYLVDNMVEAGDNTKEITRSSRYVLNIHDDISPILDGPYFTISKMATSSPSLTSQNAYEIDIGYTSKDLVTSFNTQDDQSYSILYEYNGDIESSDAVYRIGDNGDLIEIKSPTVGKSSTLLETTNANKNWWSKVTQFPIKASMEIRGLLRAIILMSYIKINVYFYGKKHISSGLYCVTRQTDNININGYYTTLELVRIGGDTI